MADENVNPDEIQRVLDGIAENYDANDPEVIEEASASMLNEAQRLMVGALKPAVETITRLAKHADSELLQFNAAKFLIEWQLVKPSKDGDPSEQWKELMEKVHGKQPATE